MIILQQLKQDKKQKPKKANSLIGAGDYKGYGLASMVEILCGIYTGMNFGREIPQCTQVQLKNLDNLDSYISQ